MNIFAKLDQLPSYFLEGAEDDNSCADSFTCIAEQFLFLFGQGLTFLLEEENAEEDDRDAGELKASRRDTCAEKLRSYMQLFQNDNDFEQWNYDYLSQFRHRVLAVVRRAETHKGRT